MGPPVQTPVGGIEEEEVTEGEGHGGLDSATLSAVSISNGTDNYFGTSEHEIYYQNIRIQPTSYQDDLMRMSETVEDTAAGITRFEAMAESKLLTFNSTKSTLVIVGPKKLREENEKELKENPVLLYNKPMKVS